MTIIAVGIDLAKNVFAVHGVTEAGTAQLRQPKVARTKLNGLIASVPPCTIGIEACSGAHYWARQFQAHGHTVRLIAPKLVTPYRMSGKRRPRGQVLPLAPNPPPTASAAAINRLMRCATPIAATPWPSRSS